MGSATAISHEKEEEPTDVSPWVPASAYDDSMSVEMLNLKLSLIASRPKVLHPDLPLLHSWDLVVVIGTLMTAIKTPFDLAFLDSGSTNDVLFWLMTALFTIDMMLKVCRGFYRDGEPVLNQGAILNRYMRRGGFLADVLSTWVATLSWWRAFKLLQILRLVRVQSLLQTIEERYVPAEFHIGLSLAKTCGLFGLMCHWSACTWGAIGHSSFPLIAELGNGEDESGQRWIQRQDLVDEGTFAQYITALNFATGLMTGGETYISPVHLSELLYTTSMLFASFFICSTLLSQIVVTVSKLSEGRMHFKENLRSVMSFMSSRNVPRPLQERVRRYLEFRFRYRARCVGVGQATFIQDLSSWLQLEVTRHLLGELICNHPYFKAMPAQALNHILLSAAASLFSAGEAVIERGKTSELVVFVAMGRLASLTDHSIPASRRVSLSSEMTGTVDKIKFQRTLQMDEVQLNKILEATQNSPRRQSRRSSVGRSSVGRASVQTIQSLTSIDLHVASEFGTEVTQVIEKGMWFDDMCLFREVVRIHTIISLVDSELIVISRSSLLSLRERFPELAAYHDDVNTKIVMGGVSAAGFLCSVCSQAGHCQKDCPIAKVQDS